MKKNNVTMKYACHDSPVGRLVLTGRKKLESISFEQSKTRVEPAQNWQEDPSFFKTIVTQLDEYFAGSRTTFGVDMELIGTDFQQTVWHELARVPYGTTVSYGELAARIGNPKACRAVGLANGKNPIPIIIPCHRVIGKDGSLTGFGGGMEVKQTLPDLERPDSGDQEC